MDDLIPEDEIDKKLNNPEFMISQATNRMKYFADEIDIHTFRKFKIGIKSNLTIIKHCVEIIEKNYEKL